MEFDKLSEKYKNFYAPNYQILVDDKDILREHFIEITNVTFEDTLEGADRFSFSISDPGVESIDSDLFEPDGTPQLEVSGFDLSHQFTRVREQRHFDAMKDSDIVAEIVSEATHKLQTQIKDTETEHRQIAQDRKTDYEFIKERADHNFFEFFVRERTLYFRKPTRDLSEIVTLKYGVSLLSFNPELNTANQVSEVTVRGCSEARAVIVGRARHGSEEARGSDESSGGDMVEDQYGTVEERIMDRPVFTQQEADTLARSILNRLSEGLITGRAECIGIPELRAGENIKLEGLGSKFSRKYYIAGTTHTISNSGYSTSFNIKENTI
jgi:phage protein D